MISGKFRSSLFFVLTLAVLFSSLPLSTTASETEPVPTESEYVQETETISETVVSAEEKSVKIDEIPDDNEIIPTTESILVDPEELFQARINEILVFYLGSISLSTDEIYAEVDAMESEYVDALMECYDLDEEMTAFVQDGSISQEQVQQLLDCNSVFLTFYDAVTERYTKEYSTGLFSNVTGSAANNAITVQYDNSYASYTNSQVSVSITGGSLSRKNTTVTLTNATSETVTLAFDYIASNYNSFTIGGSSPTNDSGSYSIDLAAESSIELYIQSGRKSSGAATLSISNIKVVTEAEIMLDYNSSLGSVTVGGITIADGEKTTIPKEGATIVAIPASGATFLGWVNSADSSLISSSSSYQLTLDQNTTVNAVFVNNSSVPYFRVGTAFLFDNLNDAIDCTSTSGIKTIISVNDGTLAVDDYIIPSDVTFLIPFDSSDTIFTTDLNKDAIASTVAPSAYRTLIVPSGATITCNGVLNVNGQRSTSGQPTSGIARGKHGKLVLNGTGTQLTMASGSALYCYGYITGSGRVELASNSKMHELLQLCDWPGGTNASDWNKASNENKMFLSSRYYIQNVEAPLRINAGANVYCEAVLYVAKTTLISSSKFIAPAGSTQGLFLMGSGTYIDRTYDASSDRITYALCANDTGTIDFGSIEVELDSTIKALLAFMQINLDLNSSSYILPLNSAMTVTLNPGVTLNMGNRVAVLPGSQVIVEENATLNLTNHAHIVDKADWIDAMSFGSQVAAPYTVGRGTTAKLSITDSGRLEVNGTLKISGNGGIYTTTAHSDGTTTTTSSTNDKIIYGTGTIIHEGAQAASGLAAGYNGTLYSITSSNALGNLAGLGEMKPFSTDTYYGLGSDHNNYWYQTKDVHDPNCTEAGYTIYNCTDGSGYTVAGDPALGHTPDAPVITNEILPTYQAEGSHVSTINCSVCGGQISSETVTIPKVVQLNAYAASAAAEVYLEMKFFLPVEMADGTIHLSHPVTKNGEATNDGQTYNVSDLTPDSSGRYVISHGIASGEMTCPVIVTFKDGNTTYRVRTGSTDVITDNASCAVTDYAKLVLDKGSDAQKELITSLVTYGGYAQKLFNVDAENPAFNILTEVPSLEGVTQDSISNTASDVSSSGSSIGIQKDKQQAFLDSAIYHEVYFTLDEGYSIDDFTFILTYPVNHKEYTKTLTPVYDAEKKRYDITIEDIPAAYLDYDYKITVTNKETSETYTVTTSVLAYLKTILSNSEATDALKNQAKAMYLYNQAANTYFGK